jgi:hypothetical protein
VSEGKKTTPPAAGNGAAPACGPAVAPCPLDCPTKVEFKEHNSVYGFDDNTDAAAPWKSVEKGKSDTVKAEITPAGKFANVQFASSVTAKVSVSPATATSDSQIVTVNGIDNGESEIKATCGGADLGKLKVKTYTRKTKTVAVRLVHEKNYNSTDVPDADISSYLKKVYDQAVFAFTVTRLPAKTVEFDLNKDGKIDVGSWMSAEMRKIRDECKDDSYDYNLFLVDKPSDNSAGFMDFNQRYGFIHPDVGEPKKTVAHELGHGSSGLAHTPGDSENIMYSSYSSAKWRLRKDQWDKINP